MSNKSIHINCDLGEGGSYDEALMALISACNIACGGHAGNLESMRHTVDLAMKHDVEIGAHPSYPDRENFGRRSITMDSEALQLSIEGQILGLKQIIEAEGGKLTHVKPHGALYNDAAMNEEIAAIVLKSLDFLEDDIILYVPVNSVLEEMAMGRYEVKKEAFADRNYHSDYSLVSRSENHAVISQKKAVFNHLFSMVKYHKIRTISDDEIQVKADTFCLHSDTESSVEILKFLHHEFAEKGFRIQH